MNDYFQLSWGEKYSLRNLWHTFENWQNTTSLYKHQPKFDCTVCSVNFKFSSQSYHPYLRYEYRQIINKKETKNHVRNDCMNLNLNRKYPHRKRLLKNSYVLHALVSIGFIKNNYKLYFGKKNISDGSSNY